MKGGRQPRQHERSFARVGQPIGDFLKVGDLELTVSSSLARAHNRARERRSCAAAAGVPPFTSKAPSSRGHTLPPNGILAIALSPSSTACPSALREPGCQLEQVDVVLLSERDGALLGQTAQAERVLEGLLEVFGDPSVCGECLDPGISLWQRLHERARHLERPVVVAGGARLRRS